MGNAPAKPQPLKKDQQRLSRRKSKIETVQETHNDIRELRYKIENNYDNANSDEYFAQLQRRAEELQEMRKTMKKPAQVSQCNAAIQEINDCIKVLKDKISNEDSNLDLCAVESTSFICQDVKELDSKIPERTYSRIERLSQIEEMVTKLDKEIRESFRTNDINKLTILGKKTEILYRDVEQISPPLTMLKQKEALAEKLLKMNKKINSSTQQRRPATEDGLLSIIKIEQDLSDLEVQALTFEETKMDPTYKQINKKLRDHFTVLENIAVQGEDAKHRVFNAKTLIKKIINELDKKVVENDTNMKRELDAMETIRDNLLGCKIEVDNFTGVVHEEAYIKLDQKLRAFWAQLNNVGGFDKIKQDKALVIKEVQALLKLLNDKAGRNTRERNSTTDVDNLLQKGEQLKREWLEFQSAAKNVNLKKHASLHNLLEDLETSVKQTLHGGDAKYTSTPALDQETPSETIFSIHRIDQELSKLHNQISNGIEDPDVQDEVENQLIRNKHNLESIRPANAIVSSAKDRVLRRSQQIAEEFIDKIQDAPTTSRRAHSINTLKESIIDLETNLGAIENEIAHFKGTKETEEYVRILDDLAECKHLLENIDVRQHDELWSLKGKVLRYVEKLQNGITHKAEDNQKTIDDKAKLKSILQQLQQVEMEIAGFQGVHKDENYTRIENALHAYLDELNSIKSEHKKINRALTSTTESINQLLVNLNDNSTKTSNLFTTSRLIETAKTNMLNLRQRLESYNDIYQSEAYHQVLSELNACEKEVIAIPDGGDEEITKMKMEYLQFLKDLGVYLDERSGRPNPLTNTITAQINSFETAIANIKHKIEEYDGTKFDPGFIELDSELTQLVVEIDAINDAAFMQIQSELINELNNCCTSLEQKCRANLDATPRGRKLKEILEVEDDLKKLNEQIVAFNGQKEDAEHVHLDEALVKVFLALDQIGDLGEPDVKKMKRAVLGEIQKNMKLLDDKVSIA